MKLIILSDIHANVTAFDTVMRQVTQHHGDELFMVDLGDNIGYGMRPNEILDRIRLLERRLLVNLVGNHERAVLGLDIDRFSTERGKESCRYTREILESMQLDYIRKEMSASPVETDINGYHILFVHGDLTDPFFGKMTASEMGKDIYSKYDYVISGHSHIPGMKTQCFVDDSNIALRGKKRTVFINPGSVGQPRNHNPSAQYCVLDLDAGSVWFNAVPYDIEAETRLYKGEIDYFYRDRLKMGV